MVAVHKCRSEVNFHKLHVIHFNEVLDSRVLRFSEPFCNHYESEKFSRASLALFYVVVDFQFSRR